MLVNINDLENNSELEFDLCIIGGVGPTSQVVEATGARDRELNEILAQWQALRPRD